MFEDELDPLLRQALLDRFETGELSELLGLSVSDLLSAFPDEVAAVEHELRDLCGLEPETDNYDFEE